jgi:hypothetical protein
MKKSFPIQRTSLPMRRRFQFEPAWGAGDSAASRVVVAVCGYTRATFNSECRQVLELGVGGYQRSAIKRQQRATQPATQRSPPSPRAPFALFHTKRGERAGGEGGKSWFKFVTFRVSGGDLT